MLDNQGFKLRQFLSGPCSGTFLHAGLVVKVVFFGMAGSVALYCFASLQLCPHK